MLAGIGRTPSDAPAGYSGTALHVPTLTQGRIPFFPGAGASLYMQYGNNLITTYVLFFAGFPGSEYQGYTNIQNGPAFGQAYMMITPEQIGSLRLSVKVGGFVETYAGPGQWGWGLFGPALALRGFGETSNADIDLTRDLRLTLTDGVLAVPGVAENYVRGNYDNWIETGTSSYLHHVHAGITYKNQYVFKLHEVTDWGTDERKYLETFLNTAPHDGRMDALVAELRWLADPYGQVGVSGGLWNFDHAASVTDGVWWSLDYTQGSREMINKYLGPASNGTGKFAFVTTEYDTSLSRILWYPHDFDGRAPDLRIGVAAQYYETLATEDPNYLHATGYYEGVDLEYRFYRYLSLTFQQFGESRDSNIGRWNVFSLNPGIAFHSDWTSTDRIMFIYDRRFYSGAVDNNSAQPLDRNVFILGGYIQF